MARRPFTALACLGALVDAAIAAGATDIPGMPFESHSPQVRRKAA